MIQKPLRLFLLIFLMANSTMAENKKLPKDQKPPEHTLKEPLPAQVKEPAALKKEPLKIIPDQKKRPRQNKKISAEAAASLKALKITIPTTAQKMAAKRLIRLGRKNFTLQELRIAERLVEMGHTHFTDSQITTAERLVLAGKTNFSDLDISVAETPLERNKIHAKPPLSERERAQENILFPKTQKIKTPAISLSRMFSTPGSFENAQDKKKENPQETNKSDQTYFSISQERNRSQTKHNDHLSRKRRDIKRDGVFEGLTRRLGASAPKKTKEDDRHKKITERISQQLKKLGQRKITDADILRVLKLGPTGRKVFDAITADRKTFSRLNSLDKIRQLLEFANSGQYWPYFTDASHILGFAKRVNQEHLCLNDLPAQCAHVWNAWTIMQANEEEADLDKNDLYEAALDDRALVYQYIHKIKAKEDFGETMDLNDQCFYALRRLAEALKMDAWRPIRFKKDEDLSIGTALSILDFQEQEEDDRKRLWKTFWRKRDDLWNKAYSYLPWDFNLVQDNSMAENMINDISYQNEGVNHPVSLEYRGLTCDDYFAAIFDQNFLPVSLSDFEQLRQEALSLVEEEDFDLIANPMAAMNYRFEINHDFDRIIDHDNAYPDDHWKERVWAISTKVPAMLVSSNISRPGTTQHNPALWNTALKEAKKRILQHILGAIQDCNTGVTQKLRLLEEGYQEILTDDFLRPQIAFFEPVAHLIRKIKIQRIQELGTNPFASAYEENITAPHVAMQRMRLSLSLMGNYEDVVAAWLGKPNDPKNSPEQIIRNLFLAGQPNREYSQWGYDYMNGSYYPLNTVYVPAAPHLTVKSLVDRVYEEFDKSITWKHLNTLVNGELTLRKDRLIPVLLFDNGVFVNKSPPGQSTAKGDFSKNMAFYLLEKMNYVKIQPHIKDKVYQYDEETYAPGSVFFQGRNRTLEELIDLF